MKLFVLLFIGITIKFSEEIPASVKTPEIIVATESAVDVELVESKVTNETSVTSEPEETVKTVSLIETEVVENNSTQADQHPEDVPLPVDLLSGDILFDPSVILARAERSVDNLEGLSQISGPIGNSLDIQMTDDEVPTFYFVKFVRVPRSLQSSLIPDRIEHFRMPEELEKHVRRFSRSAEDDGAKNSHDLHGAEGGFIIRPLFKYRHEELKRSNRRKYSNKNTYYYYPRYPVFPGK